MHYNFNLILEADLIICHMRRCIWQQQLFPILLFYIDHWSEYLIIDERS